MPRKPAEVLARGYGDCKDKAAFLVALLRAAGVPAHVGLLRVSGLDIDPKLPTFDGFDHAIVYVPPAGKAPALWIDATNPYAAVGETPRQRRRAAGPVATPRTDALVTTPAALAGLSRVKETRRIVLGESGHPRVIERTEAQGGAARRAFRQIWSTTPRKQLEEEFTGYVKEQYMAKALTRLDIGAPADLSKPVLLELEASDAEIGFAWDEGAQVMTRAGQTLVRLPPTLRAEDDDARAIQEGARGRLRDARALPLRRFATRSFRRTGTWRTRCRPGRRATSARPRSARRSRWIRRGS